MGNMKNAKRSRLPSGSKGSPAVTPKGKATVLGVVTSLEKPIGGKDDELPAKQAKKRATQKGVKDDEKEVSKKEVSKKEVSKKEVSKKEVSKKKVSKKEVSKKEVFKKDVSKKDVSKKEVSKKEMSKKEVSKKEVSKKEVSKKEVSKKETVEPKEKTLLPDGCEVPVEVTPVLLIKNVFTEQGECLAPEGKGQFMEGNRIQLVGATADSGDETPPKVTPRRGGRLAKKQEQPSGSSKGADKTKNVTQKDTKRGRTPKGKVDSTQEVYYHGVILPNTKSNSSLSNKGASDGEKSEKVESMEDSAPREKRGRPPKRKLSDAGADESNSKKAKVDSEPESPVKKRGRGRPPKQETGNSTPKKYKKPPPRKSVTPGGAKNVKSKVGRPRWVTESSDESWSDTPAGDSVARTPDIVATPILDSASARRSRQLKAKKIFEDYEEYTPSGKPIPIKEVEPVKTTPRVKKIKKTKKVLREGPIEVVVQVNTQLHSSDDDTGKVTDTNLEDGEIPSSKSGGALESGAVDASKKPNVSSTDSLNAPADHQALSEDNKAPSTDHKIQSADHNVQSADHNVPSTEHKVQSADHKVPSTEHKVQSADHEVPSADHKATPTGHQAPKPDHKPPSTDQKALSADSKTPSADHKAPSSAQVIIIKSKPKTEGSPAGKSKDKPTPVISVKCTAGNSSSKQTKVLPSQNKMPRQQQQRNTTKRLQVTSMKSEMCVAPEIKLDLPVGPLVDSINLSTQPEIRTLYMFQNTSTNGWLKIICKRISGVQFYQCPLCPYKDPVPRKVADHLHEDHPSLVSIAEGKCTRIFATFLFMFCRHCDFIAYEKLALWYHFEQYHGLTDMINSKPIDPDSINMAQFPPVPDCALKTANTVLRCNECEFLSLSKRHAMNHVLKEHSTLRSSIGNGFVIISQLDAISSSSGDAPPPSDALNLPEELKSMVMKDCFVCTECMFVTYKRALMEIHCVNNHAKRLLLIICSVCGDQFDTTYKMSNHIANSHSETKRQFCSVTLVDADAVEDSRLVEYNKQRKAEAAVAAAAQALVSTAATASVAQSTATTVTTGQQKRPAFTGANTLHTNPDSRVSAVKTPQPGRPLKTRPVAVVSGSSCDQVTSARKVWPGQSLVKPVQQQQQHRGQQAKWLPGQTVPPKALPPTTTSAPVRSAEFAPSAPSKKVVQIQPDTRQQTLPVAASSPVKQEVERQLTYIQMPDGSHHQVELAEDENGQLQYVLTEPPVTEVAPEVTAQETTYVKLADGIVQPLASAPEGEPLAEATQEIRYLQMPDGTLHELPAESEGGGEIHYMQLADGSLQQISAVPEGHQSAEGTQEVQYLQFPDGSIQQMPEGGPVPVECGDQVLYGKLPDGTIQQLTEGAQLPEGVVQTVTEDGQEMHCIQLPDGRFQQITEGDHEVCYVKMPDGSIQQVAQEGQSVENGDGSSTEKLVQLKKETTGGQTVAGEQYVQYVIEMDGKQQPEDTSITPHKTPCVADGNNKPEIVVQTSGSEGSHVTAVDQSAVGNAAESRADGTKMVSLLSHDVLANVQAQQTTVATAAPSESGTQQRVMQAYNVNGETIILCRDPQAAVTDQQAAQALSQQALSQPTTETGNAASNGQQVLYIENEPTSGNFEDAFQTFVNSNSTQQQ